MCSRERERERERESDESANKRKFNEMHKVGWLVYSNPRKKRKFFASVSGTVMTGKFYSTQETKMALIFPDYWFAPKKKKMALIYFGAT